MRYDFETLEDRSNCGAIKWDTVRNAGAAPGIVPFSVADMEFKNPPEIVEGLKDYLDTHILGYTSPTEEYYEAVRNWMQDVHGWTIRPEEICPIRGVVPALNLLVKTFCAPGDGVIVMPPIYPPFYHAVELNGGVIKRCPLVYRDYAYTIDFDLLEKLAAEEDSKMLIFCSPHNPVGRVWTKEELKRVGDICTAHGVKIISDEIHSDIIMPGYIHTPFAAAGDFGDNVIVCTAPSKTFNLAAMQTSNIIIPGEGDREKFGKVREQCSDGMPSALGLEACRLAYTKARPWMEEMIRVVWGNYQLVVEFLKKRLPQIKAVPLEGTYLMWLDCTGLGVTKERLEEMTVKERQLFLDEGYIFGEEGACFERVNLACPRWVLEEALERAAK